MVRLRQFTPVMFAGALAACSGATPSGDTTGSTPAPRAALKQPFTDAGTGRALGADQEGALDGLARGASAGTLLARSEDDTTCIFANGRDGWNPAAC